VFSSDGTKLLYTTTDSHSILVDLGDSSTTDLGPLERIIALSPSGEHVVTQGVGLEVVSVAADKVARVDGVQKVFGWLDTTPSLCVPTPVRTGWPTLALVPSPSPSLVSVPQQPCRLASERADSWSMPNRR